MAVAERIAHYHRTPKGVLRALERAHGGEPVAAFRGKEAVPFTKAQILQWVNAAAPLAASELINQLVSKDEDIRHKATVKVLEWTIGKPRDGAEGGALPLQGRTIEIRITDPNEPLAGAQDHNGNIIDGVAEEGGSSTGQ